MMQSPFSDHVESSVDLVSSIFWMNVTRTPALDNKHPHFSVIAFLILVGRRQHPLRFSQLPRRPDTLLSSQDATREARQLTKNREENAYKQPSQLPFLPPRAEKVSN